jgi:predicted amidophosphoribosyltransferase
MGTYEPLCDECDAPLSRDEHDLCTRCERLTQIAEDRLARQGIGD